jgi:hypothetical protein
LHGWYYYPDVEVYFNITDRYYYYLDGVSWRRANYLPSGWILNHNRRVRIDLAGRPYVNHSHYRRQYPGRTPNQNRPRRDNDDRRHNDRHDRDDRRGQNDNHENRPNQEHHQEGRRDEDRNEKRRMYLPHTKGNVKIEKQEESSQGKPAYSKGSADKKWKNKAKQSVEKGEQESKRSGKVSTKEYGNEKYRGKRDDDGNNNNNNNSNERKSNSNRRDDYEKMMERNRYRQ